MDLDGPVFPGDILTAEHLAGRDVSILTRYGYAEFVMGDAPVSAINVQKTIKAETPVVKTEEVTPLVKEAEPVKAIVEKRGVWFQVFANGKKLFNSRNEKEAKEFAKEFNAAL